ncbi:MAG: nicotinamide-nucleotide adenylyltransferase [Thermoplasmatota archaeon]
MRGIFIGRFQPFHKGHLSIIEEALGVVDELVIGIGSAESSFTEKDPFTAGERIEMLRAVIRKRYWQDRIILVPIRDVNRYSIWVSHVVSLSPRIDVVFSNNPLTVTLFKEAGYKVTSTKLVERENYSGIGIRKRIAEGVEWEHLVPEPVSSVILSLEGDKRIKNLMKRGGI